MPTEDDRKGKLLPDPVDPGTTVCFTIQIPNAVQYRAAFLGQINALGVASTWDHPTDGTECEPCEIAAQLWRNAIYEATWSDDCEGEVNCDEVANCIATSEAVQDALATQIELNTPSQGDIYNTSYYGTPMSSAAANANLTGSAGCDLNSLFGSVTAIVDQLNRNNLLFLARLEVTSNTVERVEQLIAAIPFFETLPLDDIVGFANTMQEQIKENYESTYTDSYRDEIRCGLFCLAQDAPDCELSFEMIQSYFENRLGASFDPERLFVDMVLYFTVGTWSGTQIIDMMTLVQVVVWKVASNWIGLRLRTLQLVGALGANDDDPDWELLCEECPPDPDPECIDLRVTDELWVPSPNASFGQWISGQGLAPGDGGGGTYFNWQRGLGISGFVVRLKVRFNQAISNFQIKVIGRGTYLEENPVTEIDIDVTDAPTIFPFNGATSLIEITPIGNIVASSFRVIQFCIYYEE